MNLHQMAMARKKYKKVINNDVLEHDSLDSAPFIIDNVLYALKDNNLSANDIRVYLLEYEAKYK